jgi:hypothetical protein
MLRETRQHLAGWLARLPALALAACLVGWLAGWLLAACYFYFPGLALL